MMMIVMMMMMMIVMMMMSSMMICCDVKAKDRLTRAARESDARRFARTIQQVDLLSSLPVNNYLSTSHI